MKETDLDVLDELHQKKQEWVKNELKGHIEALFFAATEALTLNHLKNLFKEEGYFLQISELRNAVDQLLIKWEKRVESESSGIQLVERDGHYMFRSVEKSAAYIKHMYKDKPTRLSKAALETLSIVAYRQPITRPQIDEIRGVDSAGSVRNLLEKNLLRIIGKADEIGRPLLYGTSSFFLDFFNITRLSDLPTLKEFHALESGETPIQIDDIPEGAPVRVMDLFHPDKQQDMVSEQTEEESLKALNELEKALGEAVNITRKSKQVDVEQSEIEKANK